MRTHCFFCLVLFSISAAVKSHVVGLSGERQHVFVDLVVTQQGLGLEVGGDEGG